jgi:hypothetical protein
MTHACRLILVHSIPTSWQWKQASGRLCGPARFIERVSTPDEIRSVRNTAPSQAAGPAGSIKLTMLNQIASEALAAAKDASRPDWQQCGGHRLLMSSGGRDSTLAAVRMARDALPLALVTVSSSHLFGIERVKARLGELAGCLDDITPWLHVRQPIDLRTDTSFYGGTVGRFARLAVGQSFNNGARAAYAVLAFSLGRRAPHRSANGVVDISGRAPAP